MKTKNKIISISLSLCLALLSGCSQGGGSEPTAPSNTLAESNGDIKENTPTVTTEAAVSESAPADTTSEEPTTTEAENQASDERFAYYDLLREEYEKYGCLGIMSHHVNVTTKGKIFFFNYENQEYVYRGYDINEKKITSEAHFNGVMQYVDGKNGYLYGKNGSNFCKYDLNGNIVKQMEVSSPYVLMSPDETLFDYSNGVWKMSTDWKTMTDIPPVQKKLAHGMTEDVSRFYIMAKYGNKVYAFVEDYDVRGLYCLNTDTMTWANVDCDFQISFDEYFEADSGTIKFQSYDPYIIGKYFILRNRATSAILDMETDTIVANMSGKFTYEGNDYIISVSNEKGKYVFAKEKYPGDGSEPVIELILDKDGNSMEWDFSGLGPYRTFYVDEQYFVLVDDYGKYLYEYSMGVKDGKETVLCKTKV